MKPNRPSYPSRVSRDKKVRAQQDCEQAIRACEAAAAAIHNAGCDLATSWTALCQSIAAGLAPTELLKKRAWCNVLELRLKEQAHALEEARLSVDALWDQMMLAARARELFNRFLKRSASEDAALPDLPLLARTASAIADAHRVAQRHHRKLRTHS